jgi:hypothetical protein
MVGVGVAMLVLGLEAPAFAALSVGGFSPASGPTGCVVVITGTDFNNPTVTSVAFGAGTATDVKIVSGTEIWATVPGTATDGPITLTNSAGQTATSSTNFAHTTGPGDCAPTIASFTPTCGPAGTDVTITGTNLLKSTLLGGDVEFAPYTAPPTTATAVSPTEIMVDVPAGAQDGPLTVTTFGGSTVISGATFDAGTCITDFNPKSGDAGTAVTITGVGFEGVSSVTFAGAGGTRVIATIQSSTNTETTDTLVVTAPVDGITGPIQVNTPGGNPMTAEDFVYGGATHSRTVTLALKKHLRAKGTVSVDDGFTDCAAGVPVKIQRKTSSGWKTVKSTTTSDTGAYSVKIKDKPGKYRARAPKVELAADTCLAATSPIRKHKH